MKEYFSAKQLHLPDRCLMDAAPKVPLLATYGVDNLLFTIDPLTETQTQYQLIQEEVYSAMTLAPDGSHSLFVSGNAIVKYDFQSKNVSTMIEQAGHGAVKTVKYSHSGAFVTVGAEDGKPLVYEPSTGRKEKCRPGHSQGVVNIFISSDQEYLGSIGQDQNVLIYRLSSSAEPQEVGRFQVSHLQNCNALSGCFHLTKSIAFLPGQRYLQTYQLLDSRWQMIRMQNISHGENVIYLAQAVKENTLVTSSDKEVCIWNIRTQEKLFEIEELSLSSVSPIAGTFFGMKDDGVLYRYKRELKEHEPMEIEEEKPEDRIQFEEADSEEAQKVEEDQKSEVEYHNYKKSKADKIISCLPQAPVTSSTSIFDGQRFLFVNEHGCVIERQEANGQTTIEVQLGLEEPKKIIIAHGREMTFFDLNPFALVYATEKQFGVKIQPNVEGESWERTWHSIKNVAIGTGWIAVVNEEQIKILDMCCHEIRTIAFDREVLALRAHENMLCVVYHESVPMWGAQQISMQLILVDSNIRTTHLVSTVPVPIRPESILRSIHFSQEGMIISQDSNGALRAFSLERGDWTTISIVGLEDSRKAWIIGVVDHQLLYWKTSNEDPQPTVGPRFAVKSSTLYIPTIGVYPGDTQQAYQQILWRRFVLDHEKGRSRLWGRLKVSRPSNSVFAYLVNTILSEKEIAHAHQQLDEKFFSLVQTYLKADQPVRAFSMAKSCVRTIEATKKLIELFDYYNKRNLAIQLEEYCEERQKQLEYQQMQIFQFMKMRETAERTIKPRSEDPMRRGNKKITESIPSFSQNMTQMSQDSIDHSAAKITTSQISSYSRPSAPQNDTENPFEKKKSANEEFEAKKKQIEEHVQRFSIKKKTEERGMKKNKI